MTSAQLLSFPTKRIKTARADKGLTSTDHIVQALSRAIIDHELQAGEKLKEQRIADQFGVSRTLVRQALYQLSQKHLIRIEQARGAFVATPSIKEAREVFGVRMALESAMVESLVANITAQKIKALRTHIKAEAASLQSTDASNRIELLGDFHVLMAELLDNDVLAQLLQDLISRCALITLLYQSKNAASHSHDEHVEILQAIVNKDASKAKKLMHSHLQSVLVSLDLNDA
ncbi:MAG: GntR family transcriptional regulator [Polaromonas sp.]|nr:GntR family transcriptional regulator [Polaromonas sp.]MBP6157062.1 GntR family transcriptional regulator [Polaromonas sp.]MBP7116242.1 GntR family transcriptional regulator [Polaromonas sp.]MBP7308442.1 GntR family transcriptional regulator [Polaromonas sp.]